MATTSRNSSTNAVEVAMVPQEGYLFTSSLADNLRFGEPEATTDQVFMRPKLALPTMFEGSRMALKPSSENGVSP